MQPIDDCARVTTELAGQRLDQAAARLFADYSRSRLKTWILSGELRVNGALCQPRHKLSVGDQLTLRAVPDADERWQAQPLGLSVVYEDAALLVIDKPAGLVVHPAAGHRDGTLLNALLHYCAGLAAVPRAGIVHRLDRDTTGLMVVAKTLASHASLVAQLQARSVKRRYQAVVNGTLRAGGTINEPMGRHPAQRTRMAVVRAGGKEAITHFRIGERFPAHTLLNIDLETGRTHQIRVHMAYLGHPLVGDPVYGGRLRLPPGAPEPLREALLGFRRQALHAWHLALCHPDTGRGMAWEAPLPADLSALLQALREARA